MLNEIEEFCAYTEQPEYICTGKRDLSFLGRFSFEMMLDFIGLNRVLTIIARGYLFRDGEYVYSRIDLARRALCAWCSIPDKKNASPKEDWQFRTDFRELHKEFPALVDAQGRGWFYRHVHAVERFITRHPELMSKSTLAKAELLRSGFDKAWRDKVRQYQVSRYSPQTKGAWVLRFDDILADALELGKLQDKTVSFSADEKARIAAELPEGLPQEVVETVIAYCIANKPENSEYVVLPVTNFDAYFGNTSFSRKWLNLFPESLLVREKQRFGVCRVNYRQISLP